MHFFSHVSVLVISQEVWKNVLEADDEERLWNVRSSGLNIIIIVIIF